jgi:D-glycero-alpha-D-manno-heptose-7-phosphate kinase
VVRPKRLTASAPTRIDLAGGTLDIWPISILVPGALTINLAINLRAQVTMESNREKRLVIISRDRRRRVTRKLPLTPANLEGPLGLLLKIAASFEPGRGFTLDSRATAPAGAGMGGSSALAIAVGAAIAGFEGRRLNRKQLLRRVMNVEATVLGVPTGNQDYLAAIHGGLAAYHHGVDGTRREALPISAGLQDRIVLAYTGQPRNSGFSNWDMFRRFIEGNSRTVAHMEQIATVATSLAVALKAGDLDRAGQLIGEEGKLRYSLSPTVATPGLLKADRAAMAAGALGVKVCGAGGGGCLMAFTAEGHRDAVAKAIRATGARILDASISRQGVQVG